MDISFRRWESAKTFAFFIILGIISCSSQCFQIFRRSQFPDLNTWDGKSLFSLRKELSKPNFNITVIQSVSLKHLQTISKKILSYPPQDTLTSKAYLPETATPNHYVSLVPYAHPCINFPENCRDYEGNRPNLTLCNKQTGLPWQICDNKINDEAKRRTDRPILEKMMHDIIHLSLVSYLFRDIDSGCRASEVLYMWFVDPETRMLPSLRFAQGIPGVKSGRHSGVIDLSLLGRGFSDALLLLKQTPEVQVCFTSELQIGLTEWFKEMLMHLLEDEETSKEHRMRNNHGLYYDLNVLSLSILSKHRPYVINKMLSRRCRGWKFCIRGRFLDQIDEHGLQIHEQHRSGFGHYVWYTLLAHSHLYQMSESLGANMNVESSPILKIADWTQINMNNLTGVRGEEWLVYGAQAYRIISRLSGSTSLLEGECLLLREMKRHLKNKNQLWHSNRVGMDVWNLVYPPVNGVHACNVWKSYARLKKTDVKPVNPEEENEVDEISNIIIGVSLFFLLFFSVKRNRNLFLSALFKFRRRKNF